MGTLLDKLKSRLGEMHPEKFKYSPFGDQSNKFLKLEDSKPVKIYVLPGEYGDSETYFVKYYHHFVRGFKGKLICPQKSGLGDCPFCQGLETEEEKLVKRINEYNDLLESDPEAAVASKAAIDLTNTKSDKARAKVRYAINAIVKGEQASKILDAPKSIFDVIGSVLASAYEDEDVDLTYPLNACAFEITRSDGKGQTTYAVVPQAVHRPIAVLLDGKTADEEIIEKILQSRTDLDKQFAPSKTEVLQAAWEFYVTGEQPDENKSATPAKPQARFSGTPTLPKSMPRPQPSTPTAAPVTETNYISDGIDLSQTGGQESGPSETGSAEEFSKPSTSDAVLRILAKLPKK